MFRFEKFASYDGDSAENGHDPFREMKVKTAQWTGALLQKNYPKYPWFVRVEIDYRGGTIMISLPHIMGDKHYWCVPMKKALDGVAGQKHILDGAGELLERYNLPRSGFDEADWMKAMKGGVNLGALK